MKYLIAFALLAALALSVWAQTPVGPVGHVSATSGISTISRTYQVDANYFQIFAWTADVQVVIHPLRSADQDTFVFRAGKTYPPMPIRHSGFDVIRSTATSVDISWWQ